MSKCDIHTDADLADADLVDAKLKSAYQSLKAEQPLPSAVKQRIVQQAKRATIRRNWQSWWYFSQLALGCAALVLVLSWVNPAKLPTYYQIDTMTSSGHNSAQTLTEITVQWHHLTALAAGDPELNNETNIAQQRLHTLKAQQRQLKRAGELSSVMHRQIGLLTQHKESWQIATCDNMQLNVAIELVQELSAMMQVKPLQQPQWVELQFAPTGHILAIAALAPTRAGGQCPAV